MRITFIAPNMDMSGGARILVGHAERLQEKGHEVLIVAPAPRRRGLRERARRFIKQRGTDRSLSHSHYNDIAVPLRGTGRVGPVEARDVPDADVVLATWWETAEWVARYPPAKGVPIHFIQGYEAFPGQPRDRVDAVWRLPMRKIVVSPWLAKIAGERFGIDEIALVPNSVDRAIFNMSVAIPRPRNAIGFLYHELETKDMKTTYAALEIVRRAHPNIELLAFGAYQPRFDDFPNGVEFELLPQQHKIAKLYARCRVWLSTSTSEGFNLPAMEAMACGTPIVCAKTGWPEHIVRQGQNGFIVDAGNPASFANALGQVLDLSQPRWEAMSASAVQSASYPNWQESSDLFERALLQSLTEKPPLPGAASPPLHAPVKS